MEREKRRGEERHATNERGFGAIRLSLQASLQELQAPTSFLTLVLSAGGPDLQQYRGAIQRCCCPFSTEATSVRLRVALTALCAKTNLIVMQQY